MKRLQKEAIAEHKGILRPLCFFDIRETRAVKKYLCILLAVTVLAGLCGCSRKEPKYEVYQLWNAPAKLEELPLYRYGEPATAPQTKTVTFNGMAITGEYERTDVNGYDGAYSDRYRTETGYFVVDNGTDKVTEYDVFDRPDFTESIYTEKQLEEMAWKLLATKVSDTSEYKLVKRNRMDAPQGAIGFDFARRYGEIETIEYMNVTYAADGAILYYYERVLGTFDTIDDSAITPELKKAFEDVTLETLGQYIPKEEVFLQDKNMVVLRDGRIGMLFHVAGFSGEGLQTILTVKAK